MCIRDRGGLAVGEPREDMYRILDYIVEKCPEEKPRYLMGVRCV